MIASRSAIAGEAGAFGAEPWIVVKPANSVTRRGRRAHRAQLERLAQHLVVPARLVVRMQQEVRVQIDQARHGTFRDIDALAGAASSAFGRDVRDRSPTIAHGAPVEPAQPVGSRTRAPVSTSAGDAARDCCNGD
jgi:hypothetical protein